MRIDEIKQIKLLDDFVEKYNKNQKDRCGFLIATSLLLISWLLHCGWIETTFYVTTSAAALGYVLPKNGVSTVNRLILILEFIFCVLWALSLLLFPNQAWSTLANILIYSFGLFVFFVVAITTPKELLMLNMGNK